MEHLSSESYELLKAFYNGLTVHNETLFDESCMQQLIKNDFIESHIVSYTLSSDDSLLPDFYDYTIRKKGKGYIFYREDSKSFQLSIKDIADSSKAQSNLAINKSKKADVKGWIAVGVSMVGLIIEIICNYEKIMEALSKLF